MKVVIASDKAGFELKERLLSFLREKNFEVQDVGLTDPQGAMSYFAAAGNLAKVLQRGEAERGILICGTGAGVCAGANKYEGIFAAACESVFSARMCRVVNDANVMALGGNIVAPVMAQEMCEAFLKNGFAEGLPKERKEFLAQLKGAYNAFVKETDFSKP